MKRPKKAWWSGAGPPKPVVPPRPDVRQPAAWSWESLEILGKAQFEAIQGLIEQDNPGVIGNALVLLGETNRMEQRVFNEPLLKREFYERAVYLIEHTRGSGSKDRAEAKLKLWYDLYT